jgi:hypothetical protein
MHPEVLACYPAAVRILSLLLVLALAGCEAHAELDLALGPLQRSLAVAARPLGAALELELVLLGWEEQPLGAIDRVRAGGEVVWLEDLGPEGFASAGSWSLDGAGLTVADRPRAVAHRPGRGARAFALVIDNGERAATADPTLSRVSAAKASVDALLCTRASSSAPCPHAGSEVALVVLEGGTAAVKVRRTASRTPLLAALDGLPASAGGASRLWDGVIAAAHETRFAGAGGALLGYTTGDSGSAASSAEARAALGSSPEVTAYLATESSPPAGLVPWLASGGILPADGEGAIAQAFLAARSALVGVWRLELPVSGAAPAPGQRLRGELTLRVGPELHRLAVDLPLGPGR